MAADLELDSTKEAAEAQIAAPGGALGRYAPLIAAFCRSKCAKQDTACGTSLVNMCLRQNVVPVDQWQLA